MDNEFIKYFVEKEKDWHEKILGIYHISRIGNSHKDLEDKQHYGPCLRENFYNYREESKDSLANKGNWRFGHIIEDEVQRVRKKNEPCSISEFPVKINIYVDNGEIFTFIPKCHKCEKKYEPAVKKCECGEKLSEYITIVGSIDILTLKDFKIDVDDIKTTSSFTYPRSPYTFNMTYITQIMNYAYICDKYIFKDSYVNSVKTKLIYIKKQFPSLSVCEQNKIYKKIEAKEIFTETVDRALYLHTCLRNKVLPKKDTHKYCKYCKYKKRCGKNEIYSE